MSPINAVLAMWAVLSLGFIAALMYSADALQAIGRKLVARGRALTAAEEAFDTVYAQSLREQLGDDEERREMRRLFVEEQARQGRDS